ncbi:MAG: hypothetical protein HC883_00830 [Bdellovibrionaceae bacterium]|nr:hypothetical protein [Pseudobdellovibrionaceae bacterium]
MMGVPGYKYIVAIFVVGLLGWAAWLSYQEFAARTVDRMGRQEIERYVELQNKHHSVFGEYYSDIGKLKQDFIGDGIA